MSALLLLDRCVLEQQRSRLLGVGQVYFHEARAVGACTRSVSAFSDVWPAPRSLHQPEGQ